MAGKSSNPPLSTPAASASMSPSFMQPTTSSNSKSSSTKDKDPPVLSGAGSGSATVSRGTTRSGRTFTAAATAMLPTARSPASEKSNHNDAHGKNDDKTAAAMSSRGDVSSGNSPRKQQQLAGKVESRQASTFGGGHPEIVDKSSTVATFAQQTTEPSKLHSLRARQTLNFVRDAAIDPVRKAAVMDGLTNVCQIDSNAVVERLELLARQTEADAEEPRWMFNWERSTPKQLGAYMRQNIGRWLGQGHFDQQQNTAVQRHEQQKQQPEHQQQLEKQQQQQQSDSGHDGSPASEKATTQDTAPERHEQRQHQHQQQQPGLGHDGSPDFEEAAAQDTAAQRHERQQQQQQRKQQPISGHDSSPASEKATAQDATPQRHEQQQQQQQQPVTSHDNSPTSEEAAGTPQSPKPGNTSQTVDAAPKGHGTDEQHMDSKELDSKSSMVADWIDKNMLSPKPSQPSQPSSESLPPFPWSGPVTAAVSAASASTSTMTAIMLKTVLDTNLKAIAEGPALPKEVQHDQQTRQNGQAGQASTDHFLPKGGNQPTEEKEVTATETVEDTEKMTQIHGVMPAVVITPRERAHYIAWRAALMDRRARKQADKMRQGVHMGPQPLNYF